MRNFKCNRYLNQRTAWALVLILLILGVAKNEQRAEGQLAEANSRRAGVLTFQSLSTPVASSLPTYADGAVSAYVGGDTVSVTLIGVGKVAGRGLGLAREYVDVFKANADVRRVKTRTGVKDTIIIKNGSISSLTFLVKGPSKPVFNGGGLFFKFGNNKAIIPAPVAWDAKGKMIGIRTSFADGILRYAWGADTLAISYPLYIDPSIIIQQGSHASDALVLSSNPNSNFNNGLAGTGQMWIEGTRQDNIEEACNYLIKFDSIKAKIEASAVIDSAYIKLYYDGTSIYRGGALFVAPLKASFDETTVTWNTKPAADTLWLLSDSLWIPSTTPAGWLSFDVTSYIDSIVTYSRPDSGVAIRSPKELMLNMIYIKYIRGVEYATFDYHPKLEIYYSNNTIKPSKPTLARPSSKLATDSLLLTYRDTLGDSANYVYAIKMTSPYELWVDTTNGFSVDTVWAKWNKFDHGLTVNAPNKQVVLQAFAKDTSTLLISASSGTTAMYTRAVPPDSVDYTKYAEIAVKINSFLFDDDSATATGLRIAFKDLVRYPRRWLDSAMAVGDQDTVGCDTSWTLASSVTGFVQLIPNTNNVFQAFALNGDSIVSYPDTFTITFVDYETGGGGGGVTISQVRSAISDSMDLARAIFVPDDTVKARINDSLIAFNNATYPDSAEAYVMVQDTTWGGTVLRKLKTLLGRVLH